MLHIRRRLNVVFCGLDNPLFRRMNCVRISVKDADIFKLKYSLNINNSYNITNAHKCCTFVAPSAVRNAIFMNNHER